MKFVLRAIVGVVLLFIGYVAGVLQWYERAELKSYEIGYGQGWNSGVSDAAAAYKSGGSSAVRRLTGDGVLRQYDRPTGHDAPPAPPPPGSYDDPQYQAEVVTNTDGSVSILQAPIYRKESSQ